MRNLDKSPLDKDEKREQNKAKARKMVLVMGIVGILLILAMMVEVYM